MACLWCAANEITDSSRFKVYYNSARSEDEQVAEGKIKRVTARRNGECRIVFQRDDGQMMEVEENGRLVSYNSAFPTTGYAYRYEVV
jgi:hypothetical protein